MYNYCKWASISFILISFLPLSACESIWIWKQVCLPLHRVVSAICLHLAYSPIVVVSLSSELSRGTTPAPGVSIQYGTSLRNDPQAWGGPDFERHWWTCLLWTVNPHECKSLLVRTRFCTSSSFLATAHDPAEEVASICNAAPDLNPSEWTLFKQPSSLCALLGFYH